MPNHDFGTTSTPMGLEKGNASGLRSIAETTALQQINRIWKTTPDPEQRFRLLMAWLAQWEDDYAAFLEKELEGPYRATIAKAEGR